MFLDGGDSPNAETLKVLERWLGAMDECSGGQRQVTLRAGATRCLKG